MTEPSFFIKTKNGVEFDLTSKLPNVIFLGGDSTPQFNNQYQEDNVYDGSKFIKTTLNKMTYTADFLLLSDDYHDQKLLKHEIYKIFGNRDLVRIRQGNDLSKVMYGRPTSFDIKFMSDGADESKFSIPFEIPSGVKLSYQRSNELTLDNVGFGMNIVGDKPLKYNFKTGETKFNLYNASDIKIDPYYQNHDMVVIIKFQGQNIQIRNNTNNSSWALNTSASMRDDISISGVTTLMNGKLVNNLTDFGFLTLEVGDNEIEVLGATTFDITFSFPFIYLD